MVSMASSSSLTSHIHLADVLLSEIKNDNRCMEFLFDPKKLIKDAMNDRKVTIEKLRALPQSPIRDLALHFKTGDNRKDEELLHMINDIVRSLDMSLMHKIDFLKTFRK